MEIDKLIKMATLEGNGAAKESYRAIKAELLINSSAKKPLPEGKDDMSVLKFSMPGSSDFMIHVNELDLSIIRKLIKQREESASVYDANNRKDLADIERNQIKYLKELLPPEISKPRLIEAITTAYPNGYSKKEMGRVIKEIKEFFPTVDPKIISELVKNYVIA